MSEYTDLMRAKLAAAPFANGQTGLIRLIRRTAREHVYRYAEDQKIIEFSDTDLVPQSDRDWRQNVVDMATAKAADAQTATTTAELLVIFDSIVQWIE